MWQVQPPFHLATNDMTERIRKYECTMEGAGEVASENDILGYFNGASSSFFESTSSSPSNASTITESNFTQTAGIKRSASGLLETSYSYPETQLSATTPPTTVVKRARTVPDLEATCGEMLAQMMRASKLAPKEKFMFTSFVQRCFYLFDEGSLDLHGKLPLITRPKKRPT